MLIQRYKLRLDLSYQYRSNQKEISFTSREPNPVSIQLIKQFNNWNVSLSAQFNTVKNFTARWNKSDELYYYINPRRPFHNLDISVRYFFGRPVKVPYDRSLTELDRK